MTEIEVGRLLRANVYEFVAGCRVSQIDTPSFGALVRVPQANDLHIYGLIYNIHIDDDGLVRQLVTTELLDENTIADNRNNRNHPLEMSVLCVGYRQALQVFHMLPPRPPLALEKIILCDENEVCQFSSSGKFGYFRHILRSNSFAYEELLAAHLMQASAVHQNRGNLGWIQQAAQELIILLRDDYPALMNVLNSLKEIYNIHNLTV